MQLISSFRDLVQQISSVMTEPTMQTFLVLMAGWLFARRHTVTHLIQVVPERRDRADRPDGDAPVWPRGRGVPAGGASRRLLPPPPVVPPEAGSRVRRHAHDPPPPVPAGNLFADSHVGPGVEENHPVPRGPLFPGRINAKRELSVPKNHGNLCPAHMLGGNYPWGNFSPKGRKRGRCPFGCAALRSG